jgi:hypothetical protein
LTRLIHAVDPLCDDALKAVLLRRCDELFRTRLEGRRVPDRIAQMRDEGFQKRSALAERQAAHILALAGRISKT